MCHSNLWILWDITGSLTYLSYSVMVAQLGSTRCHQIKSSFQIVTFILLLSWTDLLFFQLEWTYFSVISARIQVRVWIWSMFISIEILVPIAVFHTADQKLKISHAFCVVDHANHWWLSLCKDADSMSRLVLSMCSNFKGTSCDPVWI